MALVRPVTGLCVSQVPFRVISPCPTKTAVCLGLVKFHRGFTAYTETLSKRKIFQLVRALSCGERRPKWKNASHVPTNTMFIYSMTVLQSTSSDSRLFWSTKSDVLHVVSNVNRSCSLAGDFNIDFMTESNTCCSVEDLLSSYGLHKTTVEPSRVTYRSQSCIDNIFTNTISETNSQTVNLHMSDHMGQIQNLSQKDERIKNHMVTARNINIKKIEKCKKKLSELDWTTLLENRDPCTAYTCYHDAFLTIYESCFPIKEKTNKRRTKSSKWYTEELKKMKNRLDALDTIRKVRSDEASERAYVQYNHDYNRNKKEV
ncbi:uncharacterized protein [Leptinotarsa decemlineata]|uniref:uncharacterized protein n=1 Tax=Leptinotarsa decemlineata TaxID=7539 RepID=UPI003D305CEF